MRRSGILFVLMCALLCTAASAAPYEDYLAINMEGKWGLHLGVHSYKPSEDGIDDSDTIVDGGLRYWNSPNTALELSYGLWKNSVTGGEAKVRPLTLGINFFNNHENNIKFYYGLGIGDYQFKWEDSTNAARDGSKSNTGFYVGGGLEYYTSENFTAGLELKYHIATVDNPIAGAAGDVNLNGFSFGARFCVYF